MSDILYYLLSTGWVSGHTPDEVKADRLKYREEGGEWVALHRLKDIPVVNQLAKSTWTVYRRNRQTDTTSAVMRDIPTEGAAEIYAAGLHMVRPLDVVYEYIWSEDSTAAPRKETWDVYRVDKTDRIEVKVASGLGFEQAADLASTMHSHLDLASQPSYEFTWRRGT